MRVTSITTPQINTNNTNNQAQTKKTMTISSYQTMSPKQQSPSFGWFWEDIRFYFSKQLNDSREEKRNAQTQEVRNRIHDDINTLSKVQNISYEDAKERYKNIMDYASIKPSLDGNERGLNKAMGFSMEKYKLLKGLIVPLMLAKETPEANQDKGRQFKIPNGVLLYGPGGTGKTYLLNCLSEHINYKDCADAKVIRMNVTDKVNDDASNLIDVFENAEKKFNETGKRQVLLFDEIESILDEDNDNLRSEFLYQIKNCKDRGITWIGTTNNPQLLPKTIFKPTSTNLAVQVCRISEYEQSATMSYCWTKHNRLDKSNHDTVLNYAKERNRSFYPAEITHITDRVNDNLEKNEDYTSYSHQRVRKPVKTEKVVEEIQDYCDNLSFDVKREENLGKVSIDDDRDYVERTMGGYSANNK